jgi:hypothetical protein
MMTLLRYTLCERFKFFLTTFFILFALEWFIYYEFTPPQSYGFDYLIWLGYFIFAGILMLNSYRFLLTMYGKPIEFFHFFPIRGYQLFFSHLLFSVLEFILYFLPLYHFAGKSLLNAAMLPSNPMLSQKAANIWLEGFGKSGLFYVLVLLVIYFGILVLPLLVSIKNRWIYVFMVSLDVVLIILLLTLYQMTHLYIVFFILSIVCFMALDFLIMKNFFSPYYVVGGK